MPYASSPNDSIGEYTLHDPNQYHKRFVFKLKYNYRIQKSQQIDKMCKQYHNYSMINLQSQIQFWKASQFLKRLYKNQEFQFKIQSLAQYYKYHRQMPRFFQLQLHQILQNYQQQCRNQECQRVSKKIQQEGMEHRNLKQTIQTKRNTKKPVQKLIKNIQLSYLNFQNKNQQKKRNNSKTSKSSTQNLKFHHMKKPLGNKKKDKQNNKVQSKINSIKKKFQTKYSSQVLNILKTKRSYSKSFNLKDQHLLKRPKISEKIKDDKFSKRNSADTSLNSVNNNMSKSKSKSNLHSYKSSKLLLIKDQLNQKRVPLCQKNLQVNRENLNQQSMKKKLSNAGSSMKKSQSSSHLNKKIQTMKSVKVCEFQVKKNITSKLNSPVNPLNSQKAKIQRKMSKQIAQNKILGRRASQTNVKSMFNKVLNTKRRM